MLLVVLVLLLVGFGMLAVASLTGAVAWAWVSVGVSLVGAVALVVGWRRRSSAVVDGSPAGEIALFPPQTDEPEPRAPHEIEAQPGEPRTDEPHTVRSQPVEPQPVQAAPPPAAAAAADPRVREPGEERVAPADLAFVARLEREVQVVDELPRFHLEGCPELTGRATIRLPAREAVGFEFTPCAVCTPVRVLAGAGARPGAAQRR